MVRIKEISGVILAGGANSRFGGTTKSNMIVGGISIISRMVNVLSEIFEEIIIVANKPEEFQSLQKYKIVQDEYKKIGPLGGIHAAMNAASNPVVFVFAGDMPFISKELILRQIESFRKAECNALIPRMNFRNEPLHAIYSLSAFIKLDYFLHMNQGNAIKDFLGKIEVNYLDLEETPAYKSVFTNINTPSDLTAAETILNANVDQNY